MPTTKSTESSQMSKYGCEFEEYEDQYLGQPSDEELHSGINIDSSTGRTFKGTKFRSFPQRTKKAGGALSSMSTHDDVSSNNKVTTGREEVLSTIYKNRCTKWGVVTTIFDPTIAIQRAASLPSWCLVVVADTKTPEDYMVKLQDLFKSSVATADTTNSDNSTDTDTDLQNVFFFSVEKQKEWERAQGALGAFVKATPWRHFSRKNLGYLFAILHGAEFIFDFDDDNHIKEDRAVAGGGLVNILPSEEVLTNVTVVALGPNIFNHHPIMNPSINETSWARGFPLEKILDTATQGSIAFQKDLPFKSKAGEIGVIQFLADGNPDVDAFHRLSKTLPMTFQYDNDAHPVLVPKHSYAPYNAQATIHTANAFWAMLLPSTVPGRVSDIWRSYFAQCIFADAGLRLIFAPPKISQIRNEHNILGDLTAENDLYLKTGKLIDFLVEWNSELSSIPNRMEQLWIDLYERGYIEIQDVETVQLWLGTLIQIGYNFPPLNHHFETAVTSHSMRSTGTQGSLFLNPIAGGVLPIRRFTIRGGQMIKSLNSGSSSPEIVKTEAHDQRNILMAVENCNRLCLESDKCDAWEFQDQSATTHNGETCMLFTNDESRPLEFHQAIDNNPNFVVGFAQKRAGVLKPIVQSKNKLQKEEKVLYILHFHHDVLPHAYATILNQILPSSWKKSFMDLVVITPREVSVLIAKGADAEQNGFQGSSSLVNPFSPYDNSSRKGSNGHMSLPLARAKFPGYRGYLLVNDDAMVKLWDLSSDLWFGGRPWGTFTPLQYSQRSWEKRIIKERYPYGNYGWSWYNYDSGSTGLRTGAVRSNFDAALGAMKDLCKQETGITNDMDDISIAEFCEGQSENVLNPYINGGGKSDVLYVPGNKLGAVMSRAMTLFGEHDVFMEIAYPMIMNVVVPREKVLEMPLCDNSIQSFKDKYDSNIVQFMPYFKTRRKEGQGLLCPVIHPIKFSLEASTAYWKGVIINSAASCSWCTWWNDTENIADFWTLEN